MIKNQWGSFIKYGLAILFFGIALAFVQPFEAKAGPNERGGPEVRQAAPNAHSEARPAAPNTRSYGAAHRGQVYDSRYGHNHYYPAHGHYVRRVPGGHYSVAHGGVQYYYHGGAWYRPWGPRYVVVGPPVGVFVPFLPPFYATVWVGAVPYYYANSVYYAAAPGGYVVVDPPQDPVAEAPLPPADQVYVYPRQGQDERQQSDDKFACHKWAVGQTAFDPTQPPAAGLGQAQIAQKRADYQRAMAACLEGRGYTVK